MWRVLVARTPSISPETINVHFVIPIPTHVPQPGSQTTKKEQGGGRWWQVVANVAVAIYVLGSYSLSYYFRGERGVQRDHTKAVELYTSSAELGCSHNNLAGVYHEPGGKKKKDNFHYNYKVAAMAGDEAPRYQIGAHEFV